MKKLHTAGLLIIKDRKLLLAYSNNKRCFYLPGGKVDAGETVQQALCREILEELNIIITETELAYYTHIAAPAYGEADGVIMEQDCFFVNKQVNPVAAAEIGELRYFSLADYKQELNKAPGVLQILEILRAENLAD